MEVRHIFLPKPVSGFSECTSHLKQDNVFTGPQFREQSTWQLARHRPDKSIPSCSQIIGFWPLRRQRQQETKDCNRLQHCHTSQMYAGGLMDLLCCRICNDGLLEGHIDVFLFLSRPQQRDSHVQLTISFFVRSSYHQQPPRKVTVSTTSRYLSLSHNYN